MENIEFRDRLEKAHYKSVAAWAESHFGCFATFIDKGVVHSRIDVLGVRDVGGDLTGDIETLSIEVKRGRTPFATACGQALSYKLYTHRVYLADIRDDGFTRDEIYIASHLGVGLIHIDEQENHRECLSSPYYEPIKRFHLGVLETVGLGQCRFCLSFFPVGETKREAKKWSSLLQRGDVSTPIYRAIDKGKGLLFWTEISGERKKQLDERRREKEGIWDRRFICPDCLRLFFSEWQEKNSI